MKIRLAKKIMNEGYRVKQCIVERTAIPVRYWTMRVLNFAINDACDKRYPKDHRIAKAISLTRKYRYKKCNTSK